MNKCLKYVKKEDAICKIIIHSQTGTRFFC